MSDTLGSASDVVAEEELGVSTRPRLRFATGLAAFCLVVAACGPGSGTPRPSSFDGLEASLAIAHDSGTPVALRELTPFEWDSVYVFWGYLDGHTINEAIGHDIFGDDEDVVTEDFWLLVFMKQGEPIRMSLVSYPARLSYQTIGDWDNTVVFGPIDQEGTWGFTSAAPSPSPH